MSAWKELQFAQKDYDEGKITEAELEEYERAWQQETRED